MMMSTGKDSHESQLLKWAFRFLKSICPEYLYEEIEGDLIQRYNKEIKMCGQRRAARRLVWNVVRFCRPGILLRNKISMESNHVGIVVNHLKFATRIFLNDRFFSVLNILGLALGISVSIILLLILQNDLTYDKHYANYKNIYRLGSHYQITGVDEYIGYAARELGPVLKDEFPEIKEVLPVQSLERTLVRYEAANAVKNFYEENLIHTDAHYFKVFNHDFVLGHEANCLAEPYSVVITESMARKYFGENNPIDQTLHINNNLWKVTAVIKDIPENSHLKFDMVLSGLLPYRDWTIDKGNPIAEAFWNPDVYLYLLVPDNYVPDKFYRKWPRIYSKYFKALGDQVGGKNTPILEPLSFIHFNSDLQDSEPHGDIIYRYAFVGIGMLIVILACINYMNLSTAKAVGRATEIAVKKVVGSGKYILILTLLSESLMLAFISLVLAIAFVFLVLNVTPFNTLIGKNLVLDLVHNPVVAGGSLGIAVGIGIISGLYPAFYLSGIPPMTALKGVFKNKRSSQVLRKVLMTTQFSISIFVIACTLFMREQISYVQNKDLGFTKDNVLVFPVYDTLVFNNIQAAKNDFLQNPHVLAVTSSQNIMGMGVGSSVMYGETPTGMQQQGGVLCLFVGDDYIATMGLKLIQGRDFRPGSGVDINGAYIANESAVKLMGWGEHAIGKKVHFWGGENPGNVIGVVKDFNVNSLHQGIDPMFIIKGHWKTGFLEVRIAGEDISGTLDALKNKWLPYTANRPVEFFFLDQRFNEQYREDVIQNNLLTILSCVCIFIALLGLIGLSAFTAIQRTKEIGVRKVLGAGVIDIIMLLARDILVLVVLASVLVIPLSYWIITRWLEGFVYRVEMNYLLYVLISVLAVCFVFAVILIQSLKTAQSNPVDSLKYE